MHTHLIHTCTFMWKKTHTRKSTHTNTRIRLFASKWRNVYTHTRTHSKRWISEYSRRTARISGWVYISYVVWSWSRGWRRWVYVCTYMNVYICDIYIYIYIYIFCVHMVSVCMYVLVYACIRCVYVSCTCICMHTYSCLCCCTL